MNVNELLPRDWLIRPLQAQEVKHAALLALLKVTLSAFQKRSNMKAAGQREHADRTGSFSFLMLKYSN